jgi:hypothetical protein
MALRIAREGMAETEYLRMQPEKTGCARKYRQVHSAWAGKAVKASQLVDKHREVQA